LRGTPESNPHGRAKIGMFTVFLPILGLVSMLWGSVVYTILAMCYFALENYLRQSIPFAGGIVVASAITMSLRTCGAGRIDRGSVGLSGGRLRHGVQGIR
jgi:hypothetical protein